MRHLYRLPPAIHTGNRRQNVNAHTTGQRFAGVTVHCGDSPVFRQQNHNLAAYRPPSRRTPSL